MSPCQILYWSVKPLSRYGWFLIFQDDGRLPSLIFKSWKFYLPSRLGGPICVTVPYFVPIGPTVQETWPFLIFFKMATIHHLQFLKVRNFNCLFGAEGQYASPCQISCRWSSCSRHIAIFDFSRWRPYAWIFKSSKFSLPVWCIGPRCVTMQISCRSVQTFRCYGHFWLFKMAAVRHLGLLTVRNVNFRSCSEAQYASTCQILCRLVKALQRYGRFSIFQYGGRPPSWICRTHLHHPWRVFGGLCDSAKFGWNRCSNFNSMQVLIFCTLSLKMPIYAPQFFGIWPQNGEQYVRDPYRARPCAKNMSYDV